MKKIFLFAFVAFLFLTPVVSASASIAWTPDAISGLGDLGYSLIGGASFDFKNSKYIEGAVDVDNAIAEQQASQFLADYCLSRGIGLLSPEDIPTSDYEYYKTYYFDSITNKAWNNYRLAQTQAEQDEALRFELSNSLFAQWTGYNKLWYKNYIQNFTSGDDIIINIPDIFSFVTNTNNLFYYDNLNSNPNNFYSINSIVNGAQNWETYSNFNLLNYSFIGNFVNSNDNFHNSNNFVTERLTLRSADLLTINVDSSDPNNVIVDYGNINYINFFDNNFSQNLQFYSYNGTNYFLYAGYSSNYEQTNFLNLSSAINYIFAHYSNINLYVDGDPWLLSSGQAPANPVIPDFNDIIGVDTDDPAYDIVTPVDGVPAWFDLTSLFDAIKLAIIDAKNASSDTDGVLNIDLVLDNDGVVDDTGEVVDTKDETIEDVLDSPVEIDKTKDYPVIPLFTPPVQNAFKGTSILAELIDGTQTVLPEELILTFWGIVFVIFILGLLKILHK